MSDFPYPTRFHLPVLTVVSREFACAQAGTQPLTAAFPGAGSIAAWPNANEAIYIPFRIEAPYLVNTLFWYNGGTAAGNVDCGIFNVDGTLIVSAGSTVQSGTNGLQKVTISTPLLLQPGSYYLGLAASSTSSTFSWVTVGLTAPFAYGKVLLGIVGVAQQTSAFPLANATFATLSDFGATVGVPVCGISSWVASLV